MKGFDLNLLKIDEKSYKYNIWHLQHWMHHNKKVDYYENMNSVNPLYRIIGKADGQKIMETSIQFLPLQMVIKNYKQNLQNGLMKLNI